MHRRLMSYLHSYLTPHTKGHTGKQADLKGASGSVLLNHTLFPIP